MNDQHEQNGTATAELPPIADELPPIEPDVIAAPEDGSGEPSDGPPAAELNEPSGDGQADDGPDPDDGVLIQLQEKTREIQELRGELLALEAAAEKAKKSVKAKEEEIDDAQRELEDLILCSAPGPLFEHAKTTTAEKEDGPLRSPEASSPPPIDVDVAWRSLKIEDELGLTPGLLGNLHNANIHTIGDLTDFQNPETNGGRHKVWEDVQGVGPKAVDKIDDAMAMFWAKWNSRKTVITAVVLEESTDAEAPPAPMEAPTDFDHDPNHED